MRYKTISTLFILLLFGAIANAQNGYQSAKEKVKIGGKQIVVKSSVYLNLMPQISGNNPTEKTDCSKSGALIAPVTIETANNSELPAGIEIKRIWTKNSGVWRQIQFNKGETDIKANSIYSVARDCLKNEIKPEKETIIAVEFDYKGKSFFVRSSQTKLEAAY